MTQEFLQALNGFKTDKIPMWMMRQAGRYLPEYRKVREQAGGFLDLCYNPELASEVTLQPLRRYDFDAAIIFSDILVIPHALGQDVRFQAGEGPVLNPIKTFDDLPRFDADQFIKNLDPVFQALSLTRDRLPQNKSLIGFSGAPWTLACYMVEGRGSRDFESVRRLAVMQPDVFQNIIDHLVEAISLYLITKVKNGADALQIFDSWAGVLSADQFEKWVIEPTQKIVAAVKQSCPDTPIIGFPRLAGVNYKSYAEKTGVDGISLDQSVSLEHAKFLQDHFPDITLQGNLDPLLLLKGDQDMVSQAKRICDVLGQKRFIFNLGHGIIKETDPDTVALLVETVKNYQR